MKIILFYSFLFAFWAENAGGFALTQSKGLSLMNLTIYMSLIFWALTIARKRKFWEPNNINKYLLMMILVVTYSIPIKIMLGEVQNISIFQEIISLKRWCNPIFLFFIIFNIIETERDCQSAITGLLLLLILSVITMLLVAFDIMEIGTLRVMSGPTLELEKGRSAGFGNPNDYASYLVLFLPLILSSFLFEKTFFKRAGSVILLVMSLIGLITTGSRGGILSLLFCVLVYITVLKREKMISLGVTILVGLSLILLGVTSYSFAPSQVKETLEEKLDPNFGGGDLNRYTSGRTRIWRNGLTLFGQSPIYGHGRNSFLPLMERRFGIHAVAHNRYLSHMVEYGIIGLTIYLIILIKIYRLVWHHIIAATLSRIKLLYVSYLAGFCGYTLSLIAINGSLDRYAFWIYTAVIYKFSQIQTEKELQNQ